VNDDFWRYRERQTWPVFFSLLCVGYLFRSSSGVPFIKFFLTSLPSSFSFCKFTFSHSYCICICPLIAFHFQHFLNYFIFILFSNYSLPLYFISFVIILLFAFIRGRWGSSESIVSDCGLDDRAIEVRFPAQVKGPFL
jgi:ABC-type antimicrobial peptide transport system permease subunit